jgi:hypothetical protein
VVVVRLSVQKEVYVHTVSTTMTMCPNYLAPYIELKTQHLQPAKLQVWRAQFVTHSLDMSGESVILALGYEEC